MKSLLIFLLMTPFMAQAFSVKLTEEGFLTPSGKSKKCLELKTEVKTSTRGPSGSKSTRTDKL